MSNENFIEIDQAITDALNQFSPVRLKKAGLEAARYLRKENAFRVRKNITPDGAAFAPRKNSRKRGRMMKRIRHQVRWQAGEAIVFINGKIAMTHHLGLKDRWGKYPSRRLIGLNEKDKQAVLDIFLKYTRALDI